MKYGCLFCNQIVCSVKIEQEVYLYFHSVLLTFLNLFSSNVVIFAYSKHIMTGNEVVLVKRRVIKSSSSNLEHGN